MSIPSSLTWCRIGVELFSILNIHRKNTLHGYYLVNLSDLYPHSDSFHTNLSKKLIQNSRYSFLWMVHEILVASIFSIVYIYIYIYIYVCVCVNSLLSHCKCIGHSMQLYSVVTYCQLSNPWKNICLCLCSSFFSDLIVKLHPVSVIFI